MNEPGNAPQTDVSTKFLLRRLEEPLHLGGLELHPNWWLVVLGIVLFVALVYVIIMYVLDSRSIGLLWATLLGFMRLCVYGLLAWVFLLPADQKTYTTTSQAKVIVLFDVSDSLHVSDEIPTVPNQKLRTRMDGVRDFLGDDKVNFIASLEKKNPVTVYRFGTRLDPEYVHFQDGRVWTRDEKENPRRDEKNEVILPPKKALPGDYWTTFLTPKPPVGGLKLDGVGMDRYEDERLDKLKAANDAAVKGGLTRGTNLGESLLAVVNKELNSRVQGIIVFTDGRSNEGSASIFADLANRARSARIPIFVVGIGEDRQKIKIDVNELRLPPSIQPDDKFRAVADITGEGLAGQKLDVQLEIKHVRSYKVKEKNKEGKLEEVEKEEELDLEVIEAENENDPKATRRKLSLGKIITIPAQPEAQLDKANPPRVECEWQLDAIELAKAVKVHLTEGEYKGKRWEIAECKEDSELKFRVRVPTDKREGLGDKKFHESERSGMKVVKKPVRVLLMAAAANRDYQFVRTLLVRESEKKRLELAVYLQLPPGEIKRRVGVVQDVPPERLLSMFPDSLGKKKGDLYDLDSYDVIVAFDPDWNQLTIDQVANVKRWCDRGGGLVLIGGHINTVELVKPRDGADAERYKPIQDLLPVVLFDHREEDRRDTDRPYDLDFSGATAEMEFLKLDETLDETKFKDDWKAFFFGEGKKESDKPERGFYTYYPIMRVKPGALVVARFNDPNPNYKLKDGTLPPYLVMNPDQLARVIWIGSAETWRLREYREEFHERFWTKLVRFAAAKSKGGTLQPVSVQMGRTHVANRQIVVDARIENPDGTPLDRSVKPIIQIQGPPDVDEKDLPKKGSLFLNPRPGARDGWFSGHLTLQKPGEYELTVVVPKQPGQDSEYTGSQKFSVTESNPELDNTRPDFSRMYRLASEADEVLNRMQPGDKTELKRRLGRPKAQEDAAAPAAGKAEDKEDKLDVRDDRLRLYFDLGNASLIPTCMVEDVQVQTSMGEVNDRWSEDVFDLMRRLRGKEVLSNKERPFSSKMFSWVFLLGIGLFCTELLIRKLLRLA